MSKQTLKFNDIAVNKKDFHASKKAIPLSSVNTKYIIVSYIVKHNDGSYKYFIGYSHDDGVIRPLYVILPQMSGYIKYFENGGKHISFKMESEDVYLKYTEIWNKIKSVLNVKFHSQLIYDDKYIKTKVKPFNNTINTMFSGDAIPKERIYYVCIILLCLYYLIIFILLCLYYVYYYLIDSVLRTDKKNYPQVYLEQCKYKIKKRELISFIDDEVNLSSDDSDDLDE